jgi:hypothetical protein
MLFSGCTAGLLVEVHDVQSTSSTLTADLLCSHSAVKKATRGKIFSRKRRE